MTPSRPTPARLATAADLDTCAHTLATAQHHYEWAVWAFPRPDRLELLHRLFRLDVEVGLATASAWLADEGATVAIWSPPNPPPIDANLAARVRAEQDELVGADRARLAAADAITHPHRPTEPYWYLGTVGTRPDRRGQGLATAVLEPVLDRCDDERSVACLETSSDANVRLYSRLGFHVVVRATTDDGSLPLIVMTRDPR